MVAGGEDAEDLAGAEDGGDGVEAAGEGFADDADVGADAFVLEGEELAGAAEAGLDLVAHEEDVVFVADLPECGEVAGGRNDDAGLALDGFYEECDCVVGDGRADGFGVAEGDLAEAGGKGAEAALVLGFGGEADDGDGAAVEVIGADEDFGLGGGYAAHGLPHLRAALSAVSTASTPEFMGRAMLKPVSSWRSRRRSGSWSLRKAREVRVTFCAWATMAARMRGWQWPWLTAE